MSIAWRLGGTAGLVYGVVAKGRKTPVSFIQQLKSVLNRVSMLMKMSRRGRCVPRDFVCELKSETGRSCRLV